MDVVMAQRRAADPFPPFQQIPDSRPAPLSPSLPPDPDCAGRAPRFPLGKSRRAPARLPCTWTRDRSLLSLSRSLPSCTPSPLSLWLNITRSLLCNAVQK